MSDELIPSKDSETLSFSNKPTDHLKQLIIQKIASNANGPAVVNKTFRSQSAQRSYRYILPNNVPIHDQTIKLPLNINQNATIAQRSSEYQDSIQWEHSRESSRAGTSFKIKRSMSSTMSNLRSKSPFILRKSSSPKTKRTDLSSPSKGRSPSTSIIKLVSTSQPFFNESLRPTSRCLLKTSPKHNSPLNRTRDETFSVAIVKVQEILEGCDQLKENNVDVKRLRDAAKGGEQVECDLPTIKFDFWKKDESFLAERAKVKSEVQKYREQLYQKDQYKLLMAQEEHVLDDEEEEVKDKKAKCNKRGNDKVKVDSMTKFILQEPRIFCVKKASASTRKALRLSQGPTKPISDTNGDDQTPIAIKELLQSSPWFKTVLEKFPGPGDESVLVRRAQSSDTKLRARPQEDKKDERIGAFSAEKSNMQSSPIPLEVKGVGSRLLENKGNLKTSPSPSPQKKEAILTKAASFMLRDKVAEIVERTEVQEVEPMTSFLKYKRGDYRKRVKTIQRLNSTISRKSIQ